MFQVLVQLRWFFREHWKRYTIAIGLLMCASVLEVFPPKIVGMAIDEIFGQTLTVEKLLSYIFYLLFVVLLSYGLNYVWIYQLFGGAHLLQRKLRTSLMSHFLQMSPTFYEKNKTGDLMARATNDLQAISMTAGFGILTLIDSSFYMGTILISMCIFVSWKLTLAAFLPLPLMAVLLKMYGGKIHSYFTKAQDAFGQLNDRVLESIEGVRVVRAFVQERKDEERFQEMANDVYNKNVSVAKVDALIEPTIQVVIALSYFIGLGYGTYLVIRQELTLGALISFQVYLGMLIWPMYAIGELINVMQRGHASLERVEETLSTKDVLESPVQPVVIPSITSIEFRQFTFQYPTATTPQLVEISFSLKKGETLGIVGKTGSGKSTLLKQLLREYPVPLNQLFVSGVPIEKIDRSSFKQLLGYVPQNHVLFSKTIKENILFGKPEASDEEVMEAIRLAAFDQDLQMFPEGWETLVGEKGVALSGGQKQRLSIARALIKDPELLLLDDALSAVDGKTEAKIIQYIRQARKGKTTMIVTHRLTAVEHADRIIVLDDGKIIQEGTHHELIQQDGWYKEQYIRQQVKGLEEGRA
jgi:ATP-binding cassette, subfamily B, multidrug efflux pump